MLYNIVPRNHNILKNVLSIDGTVERAYGAEYFLVNKNVFND